MTRFSAPRTTTLAALAAAGALLIAGLEGPALAHGSASAGALPGLSHPLLGGIGLQLPATTARWSAGALALLGVGLAF